MNAKRWTIAVLAAAFGVGTAQATTYTWNQTAGGPQAWTTDANWSGGVAPNPISGDTVDFSTKNITAATTLSLGADRTAEVWKFGDTYSPWCNWTVTDNTITLAGTTPTINVVNNTATIYSSLAGTSGLQKTGSGTLTLMSSNSFSGGVFINAGTLRFESGSTSACLGDAGNVVTFTGNGSIYLTAVDLTFPQGIAVNGVSAGLSGNSGRSINFNGAVTGSGTLTLFAGGNPLRVGLYSTANTFSGNIVLTEYDCTLTMNSLADSVGSQMVFGSSTRNKYAYFTYGSGAIVPLVLNERQIVFGTGTGPIKIFNNASDTNTVTINTAVINNSTGNRMFTLGGSNTNNNTFAGAISDGANAVISLTKADAGKWILSGNNTFSGTTTVSDGTLVLAGSQCLSDTNVLSIASGKFVRLETGVKEKVGILKLNTVTQTEGIWGATGNTAAEDTSAYLLGDGLLYVNVDLPSGGTIIFVK